MFHSSIFRAVVKGVAGGALALPDFVVSEKKTVIQMDSQLLSAPPGLKT